MKQRILQGKKVLMLVEDTYHDVSFWYPVLRLREAGATVTFAAPEKATLNLTGQPMEFRGSYGTTVKADLRLSDVDIREFDAILVPGGYSPDLLRANPEVLELAKQFHDANKVIGTICHGAWVLISAGLAKGRRLTGSPRIKDDILNAGAEYVPNDSVIDGNVVTTTTWPFIAKFSEDLIEVLSKESSF